MSKKVIFIFFVLLFVVTLSSCKNEEDLTIYEGMVVDKIFEEGYTYTTMVPSGKVMTPIMHHVPDRYYIVIYKDEQIAKHRVTKSFYETFDIGSFVTVGKESIEVTNNAKN